MEKTEKLGLNLPEKGYKDWDVPINENFRILDSVDSLPAQAGQGGKFLKTDGTAASWADVGGGLEIGDIGFAPLGIDETQNKRRYLNGQVISQSQFVSFTNKVKAAIQLYPSLATTETNWQAEVTNSKLGQCGKFVIDDAAGTIRLPEVVNINGLQNLANLGGIKAESLPNITGKIKGREIMSADKTLDEGVLYTESNDLQYYGTLQNTSTQFGGTLLLDASRVSSTYQDNAPVQQEAIQYPYFIQVATSSEDDVDITNEIQLNNPFSLFESKYSSDTIVNASWLISNGTFHSGATYVTAYQALVVENNAEVAVGATVTLPNGSSYTKRGLSVKLSTDTYDDYDYVLNTTGTTFRLPIKVKLASGNAVAGNGMTLGLTDGTNNAGLVNVSGAGLSSRINAYGSATGTQNSGNSMDTYVSWGITTDPTKSGVETSSQGLKLYFYVGETVQDANVIAASQVLTDVADLKAHTIIDTYSDDSGNWYRVYSDGWVEQGGILQKTGTLTVNLLKPMKDIKYGLFLSSGDNTGGTSGYNAAFYASNTQYWSKTTSSFQCICSTEVSQSFGKSWMAVGKGSK